VTSTLEGDSYATLVAGAVTGSLAGLNLAVAVDEALQHLNVFVVDHILLFGAEAANFFAVKISHVFSKSCVFKIL
jgi:hypothetical protein